MASYQGHLSVSGTLGVCYGALGIWGWGLDWGPACLGLGVTTLGGVLPDLDSDSGVPQRELFGLAAAAVAFLALRPLEEHGYALEERAVLAGAVYPFVRYGLREIFGRLTVHRGMFHSIPALFIAGLAVFLLDHGPSPLARLVLAGGTMLGFLSHLLLDELWAIDFMGFRLRLNRFAGSALKLFSPSWPATLIAYLVLAALGLLAWQEITALRESRHFL
jgi:membrane-bound metal-dependent hydrolase YbcI (DUF457 family)